MKRLFQLAVLTCALAHAGAAATTITGNVMDVTGTAATGSVTIQINSPCISGTSLVDRGEKKVPITSGSFTVNLVPNTGGCSGTYYTASFTASYKNWTEIWSVPDTGSATLPDIRTTSVPVIQTTLGVTYLTGCSVSGQGAVFNGSSWVCTALTTNPMTTLGDTLYGGASGTVTRLAGNTLAAKRFLTQTGTGSASQAPAWGEIAASDIPDISLTYALSGHNHSGVYEPAFGIGTWTGTANVGLVGTTLKLGGATNSYSALIGSSTGTGVTVKDATSAAYHAVTAASFYAISGGFKVSSKSQLNSTTDGYWTMTNAAGDAFTALRFGGATSSFPAIKRDGVSLRARLADDSADTGFFALPAFVAGNVAIFGGSAQPTSANLASWDVSGRVVDSTVKAADFEPAGVTESDISDLGTAAAMVADDLSVFAATTSAQLAGVLSDEVGNSGGFTRGTAGSTDDCAKWDASGNLVSAGAACGAGGGLPSMTGNSGKLLSNNGTDADWRGIGEGLLTDASNVKIDTTIVPRKLETESISGAWTFSNDVAITGASADFDATGANTTKPMKSGTTAPATCAVGEMFYDTDASAGLNLFGCTAVDTWTLQGDGGGSPGVDSIGTSELDDGADTPLSGEYIRVDTVDQAGIEYRSVAEVLSDIGAAPITHSHAVAVELVVFDFATDTATGDGKYYFVIPSKLNGWNLTGVSAQVISVGTDGLLNVDLARCDVAATGNACSGTVQDMLSTNLTIDSNEGKSSTAAAAAVIDTTYDDVDTDEVIRVDVDAVHSTTAAKGLILNLKFEKP